MPKYKPHLPNIIDKKDVNTSINPRQMDVSNDKMRNENFKKYDGEPITNFAGKSNPYIDYQSIDLLLSIQNTRSDGYDEMCFYIMGQVKELLYKGLHFELHNARVQIKIGKTLNSIEILKRALVYLDYLTKSWDVLSTISPEGFNQFRDKLGMASGQLSFMYRHVEFILGNKNTQLALAHKNLPHIWPSLKKELNSKSLYDEIIKHLSKNKFIIDKDFLKRDFSSKYVSNDTVKNSWLKIYKEREKFENLYQLGEILISLDEKFSVYRWRHFQTVSKTIGYKPGSGGTSGVNWLKDVTNHRFFPELWQIRSEI